MKKLIFETSEFVNRYPSDAAAHAQAKFDVWFKDNILSAPLVYANDPNPGEWTRVQFPIDTHTARLIDVQEIKKECVKHEPPKSYESTQKIFCINCNVELTPEWKVKP